MTHRSGSVPDAERGIAAIWTALMLVVLVAAAGMAVDVGNWKVQASRQQNAADAASLGGVVFLPSDLANAAGVAEAVAVQHGFEPSEVTVEQGSQINQLKVTVSRSVPTSFLSVVGVNDRLITQSALAEFEAPVAMGSPEPAAGNDPESDPPNQPQYWINSAGPLAPKINGDRYATQSCGGATHGCSGSTNDDYDPNGYFFGVTVPPAMTGSVLSIQVFDGAMYEVGDTCGAPALPDAGAVELDQLSWLTDGDGEVPDGLPEGWYDDASERYVGDESLWCTGDAKVGGSTVETTFVFRAPDDTPWNHLDNEIVSSCPAVTMPSFDPNFSVVDYLYPEDTPVPSDPNAEPANDTGDGTTDPAAGNGTTDEEERNEPHPATHGQHVVDPDDGVITFGESWRRWFTMCEISVGELGAGEYLVQMTTSNGGGHNRLSLRAGRLVGDTFSGQAVTFEAKGRLPIAALAPNSNTTFSIARALPGGLNRELEIELFDMGDASNAGTLRVLPPVDSNLSQFTDCEFVRSDGAALPGANAASCTLGGVSSRLGFNGRSIVVRVPIPADYTCDEGSATGCWVRVQAAFSGGVYDTTTWTATMNGDPVRLVQ